MLWLVTNQAVIIQDSPFLGLLYIKRDETSPPCKDEN